MFDEMPDQFYQFLAATSRTTIPTTTQTTTTTHHVAATLPLTFSLHHAANTFPTNFSAHQHHPAFDASFLLNNSSNNHSIQLPLHIHHNTRNEASAAKEEIAQQSVLPVHDGSSARSSSLISLPDTINVPWSNEEVLALLKIRSSMDNTWFPPHDFTWENVSRKLGEIGFKRSAEKCKEKFEEETRSFNITNVAVINNCSSNKNNIISQNYRLFGELEDLCNNNNNNNNDHNNDINNCDNGDDDCHNVHNRIHDDVDDHDVQQSLLPQENQISDAHSDHDGHDRDVHEGEKMGQEKSVGNEEDVGNDDNNNDDGNNNVMDGDGGGDYDEHDSLDDSEKTEENINKVGVRKRKREKKFEMFKGFCEKIINKMMAQQEELHSKILQDMVKRDEEKVARENAWKKQEIERITKEMQVRAHEQTILGDRQAKMLDFFWKFSSSNTVDSQTIRDSLENLISKVPKSCFSNNNSSILSQDSMTSSQPTSSCSTHDQNPTSLMINQGVSNMPTSSPNKNLSSQSSDQVLKSNLTEPISSNSLKQTLQNPNPNVSQKESLVAFSSDHTSTNAKDQVSKFSVGTVKDDTGRRWPRDEVLALINIRCNLFSNNNSDQHDRDSFSKGPLWERISQKMLELGYKRSAKRCKEKWENINKYFRKTKDLNKKRSVDSRTCPYFYQLSHLYSQGAVHGSSDRVANVVSSPANRPLPELPGYQGGSNTSSVVTTTVHVGAQVNEATNVVQVPGFDFEF